MILKIVSLFLIFMVVLALFGRLRLPRAGRPKPPAARCRGCGAPRVGRAPCPCGAGRG